MGKIQVETCGIEGLKVITPAVYGDEICFLFSWESSSPCHFPKVGEPSLRSTTTSYTSPAVWRRIRGRCMKISKKGGIFLFSLAGLLMALAILIHQNPGPSADPQEELLKKALSSRS